MYVLYDDNGKTPLSPCQYAFGSGSSLRPVKATLMSSSLRPCSVLIEPPFLVLASALALVSALLLVLIFSNIDIILFHFL